MSKQEKIHKKIDQELDKEFWQKFEKICAMSLNAPMPLTIPELKKIPYDCDDTEGVGYQWMNTSLLWLYLQGYRIYKEGGGPL